MESFVIDIPVPSMGATVSELTVISLQVAAGAVVKKGEKLAELESDKSVFEYESPGAGRVLALVGQPGQVLQPGAVFLRLETTDPTLRHLQGSAPAPAAPAAPAGAAPAAARPIWTPRAVKLAQEAGLDPLTLDDVPATGPGGRVSGDDVTAYLAKRKA